MSSLTSLLAAPWNAAFAAKAGVVAAVLGLGLAMTLSSAEASDDWGDTALPDGNVDGAAANVLGAADGTIVQVGTIDGGGSITIGFTDSLPFDGPGADLRVHTVDALLPAIATIEVSADGVAFISAGDFSDDAGNIDIDLGALGLPFASAVRITHVSGELPGFDVDAVTALNHVDIANLVLSIAPMISTSPGFTQHAVITTLGNIDPTEGVPVSFEVTDGPNVGVTGVSLTDALGDAAFAYVGENGPGIDFIDTWLDLNGNGALDVDEPTDRAVHQWFGVTGTIELIDVDGNGLVVGDLIQVIVDDRDLDVTDAPDTIDIVVTSGSDPAGITVTLTETGDHTGVFIGLFELGDTSDQPTRILAAVDGDSVTASYDDELDGEGNDPDAVEALLEVVATEEPGAKATICHRPPGNPGNQRTLSVGSSAVPAHLGHGDTVGECGESDVPTKQEEQQELKAERDAEREQDKLDREADRSEAAEQREQDRLDREAARNADFCEEKPDHQRCVDD